MKNRISLVVLLALFCMAIGFTSCSYNCEFEFEEELAKLDGDCSLVNVESCLVLEPQDAQSCLVFYPGAKVDYKAYLPLAVKCANQGIMFVIVKMPLDYAFNRINAAKKIYKKYPQIQNWYVGGHSLGGAMAASFISQNENFDGLVLLAAFSTHDLSQKNIDVLSVYGSNDKVLGMASYQKYRSNLPENFEELVIEGGNHAQFGNYGEQKGDGQASITAEEQQNLTVDAICKMILGGKED